MVKSHPIDETGIWIEHRRPIINGDRLLYCDRDGVIIHDRHYIRNPDEVALIDGIVEILTDAQHAAIPIVIVTNQSGIGRGYFDWDSFAAVQGRMMDLLERAGIVPSAVFACPHHPDAVPPFRHPNPPMRKPNPGMLTVAAKVYGVDPSMSLMIGDKQDDMRAAAAAGLRRGILVNAAAEIDRAVLPSALAVNAVPAVRAAIPLVRAWIARDETV